MLKLNVGFTKKVGEAHYGSRGAAVHLELEFEASLAADPERLRERVRQLFALAKSAVEEELTPDGADDGSCGGASSGQGGRGASRRPSGPRPATASQLRALQAIAARQDVDLAAFMAARFGTADFAELSILDASHLIDELQAGRVDAQGSER